MLTDGGIVNHQCKGTQALVVFMKDCGHNKVCGPSVWGVKVYPRSLSHFFTWEIHKKGESMGYARSHQVFPLAHSNFSEEDTEKLGDCPLNCLVRESCKYTALYNKSGGEVMFLISSSDFHAALERKSLTLPWLVNKSGWKDPFWVPGAKFELPITKVRLMEVYRGIMKGVFVMVVRIEPMKSCMQHILCPFCQVSAMFIIIAVILPPPPPPPSELYPELTGIVKGIQGWKVTLQRPLRSSKRNKSTHDSYNQTGTWHINNEYIFEWGISLKT